MADNVEITAGSGTTVHADEYTHSTLGSGKTQMVKLVDGTINSSTAIVAGGGVEAGALRVTIASDSTGVLSIDDNGGAITVDGTVTANLSATDNAVLDDMASKLGTIDTDTGNIVTAVQIMDDWDNAASDGASVSGDVAHDAADAGEPVKIGGKAQEPTATLEEVADNDRVNGAFDRQGRLAVWMGYPVQSADINDSTSGDNTIQAAAGAGKRIAVIGYHIVSDGTTDFRWEDGAGGTAFTGQIPLQAREGIAAGYGFHPMWVGTANTLLNLELTANVNVHGQVSFVVMED